jgi:small subunit ribosomal protein S17
MAEKKVMAAKPAVTKKEVAKPVAKAPATKAAPAKTPAAKAPEKPVAKPVAKTTATKATTVAKPTTAKAPAKPVAKPAVSAKKPAAKPIVKKVVKESDRGLRKIRVGKVVSNKMNKTIVVAIVNKVPHPLYRKVVVTTTKFKAHDENNECSIGDTVEIMETRPLSRDKYFRLVKIIEKVK